MNPVIESARDRHVAVLRLIAAGCRTVPEILARLSQYDAEEIRSSFGVLRKRGIARSACKANSWRPARYELLMTEGEAMEILAPTEPKCWTADALTVAWLPIALPHGTPRMVRQEW